MVAFVVAVRTGSVTVGQVMSRGTRSLAATLTANEVILVVVGLPFASAPSTQSTSFAVPGRS